ncbi:transposase [Pseudoalteromonas sp.]|uniref:transposase n=1 Tax=Pseudoalteromonas sp. TaxID=53249 RepID=UPI001BCDDFF5|nr:transposase [Pseudoalteromonas sp.]
MKKQKQIEKQLHEIVKEDKTCNRLQALEGVGPVCAVLIKIALGDATHFKSGREAAACFGLTPVQHSSGGKEKIGSISKVIGNKKLRSALFKGALAVVSQLEKEKVAVKRCMVKSINRTSRKKSSSDCFSE